MVLIRIFGSSIRPADEIAFARLLLFVTFWAMMVGSGLGKNRTLEGQIHFCEEHNGKVNCRGLAILLASVLRIKGIKARHITCMPYDEPFGRLSCCSGL